MEFKLSYDQLNNEYSMLMSVLGASVSKHLLDEHFTCIWANAYYYQLIGYPKQEYEARFHNHCDEYFLENPAGWDVITEKAGAALKKGEEGFFAYVPMRRPDGGEYWIKMQAVFTEEYLDGRRVAYTIMTDVTEMMQARQEKEQVQQNYEHVLLEQDMLLSALNISVSKHLLDEHFTCIWANEYYYRLIGYSRQEYEVRFRNHCDEYYGNNPDGWERIEKKAEYALKNGIDTYEVLVPMKYPDGSSYWVKLVNFFTDEFVNGCRIAYVVMTDVTELVQMQNEQDMLMSAMKVSVSKHLVDEHFTVAWANDFYYELIGYPKAEYEALFHNHCDEYFKGNESVWDQINQKVSGMFEAGEKSFEAFLPFKYRDGTIFWVKMVGFFTEEYQDGFRLAYTTMVNVTDMMQLRQDIAQLQELQHSLEERTGMLHEALEAAERANQEKSRFLSRMSHDIRTPMNVIAGMTEIADAHADDPVRVRDSLQKIRLSSRHLLSLINDVLDMSKIENGTFPIHRTKISLPQVLREVIQIMLGGLREKRQILDVHVKGVRQEQFISDDLRLRQIFLNLLSNASKFTPAGGRIVFDVEQLPEREGAQELLQFTVTDNGVGMEPAFLDHIFEAFSRERDSRTDKTEGSGLGMAITRQLVDMLGGAITVQSSPGKGSTFRVTLPLQPVPAPEALEPLPQVRILLTDDDPAVLEEGGKLLRSLGARADCAGSGEEALAMAAAARCAGEEYDLILLDWYMPGMDGLETAERLVREKGGKGPLLLLAAYDWNEVRDQALAAGFTGFVEKPYIASTLQSSLLRYLYEPAAAVPRRPEYDFTGRRFLVVEDNELNREIARELLGNMGADIETAVNGAQALEIFLDRGRGYFDLILMDIQMPVMNGYEAARAIRALPGEEAGTVPIIAITADAFTDDIRAALAAGMNGHLPKPLDFQNLAREISRFLPGPGRTKRR